MQLTKEPKKEQGHEIEEPLKIQCPFNIPIHEFPPIYSGLQAFVAPELILPGAEALEQACKLFLWRGLQTPVER
jgi:hypothetical protein